MKKIIKLFPITVIVISLIAVVTLIAMIVDVDNDNQPQTYNDVTFEVIETADSAGNYLIYDTSTGIVYKGGNSPYKPYYSENGYLYIYRDGRLQEVR